MIILEGVFVILAISLPIIVFTLVMTGDINVNLVKTKIKDFFQPKYEEDNMRYNPSKPQNPPKPPTKSDIPEDEGLRAFREELNSLDAKIKYAEELKELEEQKNDKELYLERLYADEEDFEKLYILIHTEPSIWNPISEYGSKWVKGVYQTRSEANEAISGNYSDYQIVEFNYLPRKEEDDE